MASCNLATVMPWAKIAGIRARFSSHSIKGMMLCNKICHEQVFTADEQVIIHRHFFGELYLNIIKESQGTLNISL